jgi:hypothetical protein
VFCPAEVPNDLQKAQLRRAIWTANVENATPLYMVLQLKAAKCGGIREKTGVFALKIGPNAG